MSPARVFISYSRTDGRPFAEAFERQIDNVGLSAWRDLKDIEGGEDIRAQVLTAIEQVEHLVLILTRGALASDWVRREWMHARSVGVKVSPILSDVSIPLSELPGWARRTDLYDLAEPERWRKLVQVLRGPGAVRRVPWMAGAIPDSYVPRPREYALAKAAVLESGSSCVAVTTALQGAGGYGKTTLANSLCRDQDIRFEFSDGIIRVEIGKERQSVLGLIVDLIETLDPGRHRPSFQDEKVAAEHLAQVLGDARVLFVIDDVWREDQLAPFLLGAPNCVRLVTTRQPAVLPASARSIIVDRMRHEESLALLTWRLAVTEGATRSRVAALTGRLGFWAQMLEIANGWLRARTREGEPLTRALDRFDERLTRKGLPAFDPGNAAARNRAITACLDASLEELDATDLTRLEELAVLPEDDDVPLAIIGELWHQTGRVPDQDAEDIISRLRSLSLLQNLDLGTRTLRLHDTLLWYLRRRIGPAHCVSTHAAMVAALAARCGGQWAAMASDDTYGWRQVLHHLRAAGRGAEADALLTDYNWIHAKLAARGAQELRESWLPEPADLDARLVGRSITLSTPVLALRPLELPLQLFGRLGEQSQPRIAALVAAAKRDRTFAPIPRWPGLSSSGTERLRLSGHDVTAWIALFSPDGRTILTASEDGTACLWDPTTGALIRRLRGHAGPVRAAAFSPDGELIATGSEDSTVRVWDARTGAEMRTLGGGALAWVRSVAFSPDSRCIAAATRIGTTVVWDARTGEEIHTLFGHNFIDGVEHVAYSPDGRWIATASYDCTTRVWDKALGQQRHVLKGHKSAVRSAVFSFDSHRVLTASDDGTARLWDVETGTEIHVFRGHEASVGYAAFSGNNRRIVTASDDFTARLWDAVSGAEVLTLRGHEGGLTSTRFSADDRWILTASDDCTARLWDADSGNEIGILTGHQSGLCGAAFSPDNTRIVTSSDDGSARVWEAIEAMDVDTTSPRRAVVSNLAFSPDGTRILASDEEVVRILDAATGRNIQTLQGHTDRVTSAVFSGDGRRILTASHDGTARVWDAVTGATLRTLAGHRWTSSAAFSPDGALVLTSDSDGARIWDATTGAELHRRDTPFGVLSASFSPDGRQVLTVWGDCGAVVWDAISGADTHTLGNREITITKGLFSPGGERILTSGVGNTALLWDSATGAQVVALRGHVDSVSVAEFSRDGSQVLTTSSDGTARVWDAITGGEIHILRGHQAVVWHAAFCAEANRIVTSSRDRTARVWHAATGKETASVTLDAMVGEMTVHGSSFALSDYLGRVHVFDL
jgi:WD40 repeat protein